MNEDDEIDEANSAWQDQQALKKIIRDEWFEENPDKTVYIDGKLNTKRY